MASSYLATPSMICHNFVVNTLPFLFFMIAKTQAKPYITPATFIFPAITPLKTPIANDNMPVLTSSESISKLTLVENKTAESTIKMTSLPLSSTDVELPDIQFLLFNKSNQANMNVSSSGTALLPTSNTMDTSLYDAANNINSVSSTLDRLSTILSTMPIPHHTTDETHTFWPLLTPTILTRPTNEAGESHFNSLPTCSTTFRECGKRIAGDSDIDLRIVGGTFAEPYSYPWQAILRYYKKHICSATIINDSYILTAAHCIFMIEDVQKLLEAKYGSRVRPIFGSINLEYVSVLLGAHSLADLSDTTEYGVHSYLTHPDHSQDDVHDINDIALIKLSKRIEFTDHIQPVCLPKQGEDFSNRIGVIVGWGQTKFNGSNSENLKHAKVHILEDSVCSKSKIGSHFSESPDSMICAYEFKTDACKGDSGGPLLFRDGLGIYTQVGIVSWGIECAQVGYPGVYTEVSTFTDWINNNVKENCT